MNKCETPEEPMAILRWDFPHPFGGRIKGNRTFDTVSHARQVCNAMNTDFGIGSHWVEPMNTTKSEHTPKHNEMEKQK